MNGHSWTLVLAGGDGTRLSGLTTTADGLTVPKQFCALVDGLSLMQEALLRAERVAARDRVLPVVAAQHRRWWGEQLRALDPENVIVQPENRGTANGILLGLVRILDRDPHATVTILPADHHVRDEEVLARSLRTASAAPICGRAAIVLLGIRARRPNPELGYIVPGFGDALELRHVDCFVEKPPLPRARELMQRGALWNAFIVAGKARALLALFERQCPAVVGAFRAVASGGAATATADSACDALESLYASIPVLDFSKHILTGQEPWLRVLTVPECGWSDLGTPRRVAEALGATPALAPARWSEVSAGRTLSLAAQQWQARGHGAAMSMAAGGRS